MEVQRVPGSTEDDLAGGTAMGHGPTAGDAASVPGYQPKRIPWSQLNPNERIIQSLVVLTVYFAIPAIGIIGFITVGRALHSP